MAKYIVQHRRGTAEQWASNDTVIPREGELVIEIDEDNSLHRLKIGDGVHTYAELAYLVAGDEIVTQVLTQALPRVVTVTLDVDQWVETTCETDPSLSYYAQTLTLDNVTTQSRLDLQPDADMLAEFKELDLVFVTENNGGVITVHSVGDVPLKSYTMQATIIETELKVNSEKVVGIPVGTPTISYDVATTDTDGLLSASDKEKLDGIEEGANKTIVDSALSTTSTNPIQNKVVAERIKNHTSFLARTFPTDAVYLKLGTFIGDGLGGRAILTINGRKFWNTYEEGGLKVLTLSNSSTRINGTFYDFGCSNGNTSEIIDKTDDMKMLIVCQKDYALTKADVFIKFTTSCQYNSYFVTVDYSEGCSWVTDVQAITSTDTDPTTDAQSYSIAPTKYIADLTKVNSALDKKVNLTNGTIYGAVDWNTITKTGCYKIQNCTMTADYNAPQGEYGFGVLQVLNSEWETGTSADEHRVVQIYIPHRHMLKYGIHIRSNNSTTGYNDWTDWVGFYNAKQLDAIYKNQNAFSNIVVGSTTIAADSTTDSLTLAGSNVTLTPDATNDKVTISVADGTTSTKGVVQLINSTSSTSTTTAATPSSVKSAYDLANTVNTKVNTDLKNHTSFHARTYPTNALFLKLGTFTGDGLGGRAILTINGRKYWNTYEEGGLKVLTLSSSSTRINGTFYDFGCSNGNTGEIIDKTDDMEILIVCQKEYALTKADIFIKFTTSCEYNSYFATVDYSDGCSWETDVKAITATDTDPTTDAQSYHTAPIKYIGDVYELRTPKEKAGSTSHTAPYCQSELAIDDFTKLNDYRTIIGTISGTNDWNNIISVRHRNGAGDGSNYGMYLRSKLTSESSLIWRQQIGASWKAERTLLDSSNFKTYIPYETGTCTFTAHQNTGSTPGTATISDAIYHKVGNLVTVRFKLTPLCAGQVSIGGLPFASVKKSSGYASNDATFETKAMSTGFFITSETGSMAWCTMSYLTI